MNVLDEQRRLARRWLGTRPLTSAVAGLAVATPPVLVQMRRELLGDGRLSGPTVTAMYGLYAAHGLALAGSAWRRCVPLPSIVVPVGPPLAAAGSGLVAAGMSRFTGPGQVNCMQLGELATGGVYRFSRNPQYAGCVLVFAGLGLARRSGAAVLLAAAAGAVFAWWVPVEESALRRGFGQPYERYLARTPRWLGRPRREGTT